MIDSVSWSRIPYWSYYPEDHLSAKEGAAALYPQNLNSYRMPPQKVWNEDCESFYYSGISSEVKGTQLTRIAKSTKEGILEYHLKTHGKPLFSVKGNRHISCRIAKSGNAIRHYINNKSDYVDLSWGNFQRDIQLDRTYSNEIEFTIQTSALPTDR